MHTLKIDWATEHVSYLLTQLPSPFCIPGMARRFLWFTSGTATCQVSIVYRLVFSAQLFFASWAPPAVLRDPTQTSQQPRFPLRPSLSPSSGRLLLLTCYKLSRIQILRNLVLQPFLLENAGKYLKTLFQGGGGPGVEVLLLSVVLILPHWGQDPELGRAECNKFSLADASSLAAVPAKPPPPF